MQNKSFDEIYDIYAVQMCIRDRCKTAGLKLVYSPLNGSGLVPVTHVLNDMGITDITIVPEQDVYKRQE